MNLIELMKDDDPYLKSVLEKKNMASFNFRTTSDCNMNCKYCYQHKGPPTFFTKKHLKVFKELIYKIMYERKRKGIEYYIHGLFIGGEISLSKINFEIVKIIEEVLEKIDNHEWLWLDMVSNFYDLNDDFYELIDYINSKGYLNFLRTSLDFSKDIHDSYRKTKKNESTWDNIVNNIEKFRSKGYKIQTNSVLTYDMIEKYTPEELIEMIQKIPADYVKVTLDYLIYYNKKNDRNKILNFVKVLYNWQVEDMIYRLNNNIPGKYTILNMKLDDLALVLINHNRFICDMKECYTFEAKDEEHLVIAKCHNWTKSNKTQSANILKIFDSEFDNIDDLFKHTEMINCIPLSYPCVNCELKGICEECCFLYHKEIECNEIKKEIAIIKRDAYKKLFTSKNFYDKWIDYRFNVDGTTQERESLLRNRNLWEAMIKERILKY